MKTGKKFNNMLFFNVIKILREFWSFLFKFNMFIDSKERMEEREEKEKH